jgi:hypothetical protein
MNGSMAVSIGNHLRAMLQFLNCEFKIGGLDLRPKSIDMICMSSSLGRYGLCEGCGTKLYELTCVKVERMNQAVRWKSSTVDYAAKGLEHNTSLEYSPVSPSE